MAVKTKAEVEAENEELREQLAKIESGAPEVTDEVDPTLTIAERLIKVAQQVGVLEPKGAPGGGIKFKYRGVDSTVAHVTPWLNHFGVIVVPNVREEYVSERELKDGRVVKTTRVVVDYALYGPLGDSIVGSAPGLADDFADRSTAQAMSVAYRTFLLQAFHIAATGDDPEQTGEKVLQERSAQAANPKVAAAQAKAAATTAAKTNPAEQMRNAIIAVAQQKGLDGAALNTLGEEVTGKQTAEWWDDPDELNKILAKING
jgi:ERF superfamily.